MSPAAPTTARLLTWLDALAEFAMGMVLRIHAAVTAAPSREVDLRALTRASNAIMWAAALQAVLTGVWRIAPRPIPPAPSNSPARAASGRATPAPRRRPAPAYSRAIRTAFGKHPIGVIAARICRELNVPDASELWSQDVLATQQTPAEWSATHFPPTPAPCFPAPLQKAARQGIHTHPQPPSFSPPLERPLQREAGRGVTPPPLTHPRLCSPLE